MQLRPGRLRESCRYKVGIHTTFRFGPLFRLQATQSAAFKRAISARRDFFYNRLEFAIDRHHNARLRKRFNGVVDGFQP